MDHLIIGNREALNSWIRNFKTIIDPEANSFKTQESLFGVFKWGKFKPLPKIEYVLIFKTLFAKCESCSIEDFENNSYYQVNLVHHKTRRITVHETRDRKKAFDLAETVASVLKLRLKDATKKRKSPGSL